MEVGFKTFVNFVKLKRLKKEKWKGKLGFKVPGIFSNDKRSFT